MRNLIQKLNLVLRIKCDEASRLTSESFERQLLFHERLAVRCHQLVCWSCRQFEKQLTLIRDAFEQSARQEAIDLDHGPKLDAAFKERLKSLKPDESAS